MKKKLNSLRRPWPAAALVIAAFGLAACGNKKNAPEPPAKEPFHAPAQKAAYSCPMHPEVLSDKPGACPKCGMDLEKKTVENTPSPGATLNPEWKEVTPLVEAPGVIAYDARNVYHVTARYGGRIEKLYLKYAYQSVDQGQKMMDIYSPEILTAEENFLYLLKSDSAARGLIEAARERLLFLGVTETQLKELQERATPSPLLTVFSPYGGHLHGQGGGAMEGGAAPALQEGEYVEKGATLFDLYNTAGMWALVSLYPGDVEKVKRGLPVSLVAGNDGDNPLEGEIESLEPGTDLSSGAVKARISLRNPRHMLKAGMLVRAKIFCEPRRALWIPVSASLDLGRSRVVWKETPTGWTPVKIEAGSVEKSWVEVLSGISENDRIARDAHYLEDSESFIKVTQQ